MMRPPALHNQWWDPTFRLAPGAEVRRSVIRNSIIGEEAASGERDAEGSLVGFHDAVRSRSSRLNVGDLSEIAG